MSDDGVQSATAIDRDEHLNPQLDLMNSDEIEEEWENVCEFFREHTDADDIQLYASGEEDNEHVGITLVYAVGGELDEDNQITGVTES